MGRGRSLFILFLFLLGFAGADPGPNARSGGAVRIAWDRQTRTLIEPGGLYGRIIRLPDALLCAFERDGRSWVRASRDNGRTWQAPALAARFAHGTAANPEVLRLRSGRLLLFFNERPRGGAHRFAIGLTVSADGGATWTPQPRVFEAGATARSGCWEPAALQLPSGEIQLFFANEYPYQETDEQEISLCRSLDDGKTWSAPQTISFRAGHRDGMPVPLLLADSGGIAVAIEDNGLTNGGMLQPAIVTSSRRENWRGRPVDAHSPRRWGAVLPPLPPDVYAGAPYLCQLPSGETLLSCQSTEGHKKPRMVVYIGDRHARNFANRSVPFDLPEELEGLWNSLFVKDASTVTALSSATINGVRGLWAVDGRVSR
jgi:hypothetical protein